jgi:hypothetical protein
MNVRREIGRPFELPEIFFFIRVLRLAAFLDDWPAWLAPQRQPGSSA